MEDLASYQVGTMHYSRILIAVDDDDFISSRRAFDYACTVAKIYNIPLGVAMVLETGDMNVFQSLSPETLSDWRENITRDLNTYCEKAREFGVLDVQPLLAEGNPGREIAEKLIPSFKPDLLVIGSETKSGRRKTLGTHAAYLARYASCSVIIVRSDAQGAAMIKDIKRDTAK
ncbi:universal stress protein [Lapidilactobacillus achengensis]|uniref:Universal stress protein n=1 Tax=Lapidilactobacillus achengensis TaxID=2486000 RepID=A0ABW1ULP9_9LACO|nr:universal stress protein [Lapidilactobacillus achengensis]